MRNCPIARPDRSGWSQLSRLFTGLVRDCSSSRRKATLCPKRCRGGPKEFFAYTAYLFEGLARSCLMSAFAYPRSKISVSIQIYTRIKFRNAGAPTPHLRIGIAL